MRVVYEDVQRADPAASRERIAQRARDAIRKGIEDEHRRRGVRVGESRATRRADALVLMAET